MNTKHTSGQWIAKDVHDSTRIFEIKTDTGKNIATIWQYNNGKKEIDGFEQQANAKLISAAPDMLEALQETIKYMTLDTKQAIEAHKKIISAINKATS